MKSILVSMLFACAALSPIMGVAAEVKQLSETAPMDLKDVRIVLKTNKSALSYQR